MKESPGKELCGQQIRILTLDGLSWARLLGFSEPQIPPLQIQVEDDTTIFYLQFVERIQTPGKSE